jgi:hypothetical protein
LGTRAEAAFAETVPESAHLAPAGLLVLLAWVDAGIAIAEVSLRGRDA